MRQHEIIVRVAAITTLLLVLSVCFNVYMLIKYKQRAIEDAKVHYALRVIARQVDPLFGPLDSVNRKQTTLEWETVLAREIDRDPSNSEYLKAFRWYINENAR